MAERYKVELGRAIAKRRRDLGLTQKELADATHYKEGQTVSRWERGENLPGDLDVIARALGWTLEELTAGIEAPNRRVA
jgi:transcriptional regulator with XRE-family HTH domain